MCEVKMVQLLQWAVGQHQRWKRRANFFGWLYCFCIQKSIPLPSLIPCLYWSKLLHWVNHAWICGHIKLGAQRMFLRAIQSELLHAKYRAAVATEISTVWACVCVGVNQCACAIKKKVVELWRRQMKQWRSCWFSLLQSSRNHNWFWIGKHVFSFLFAFDWIMRSSAVSLPSCVLQKEVMEAEDDGEEVLGDEEDAEQGWEAEASGGNW